MSGFGRDDFTSWITERFAEIREEGPLSGIVIEHFDGAGNRREITALNNKMPEDRWVPEQVSDTLWRVSSKFAQGLPGVQQLQAVAMYGTAGPNKSVKEVTQPFQLNGNLGSVGMLPGGGLSSEAPGPIGTLATATRWGEIAIQGANAKDLAVTQLMANLLKQSQEDARAYRAESNEMFIALKKLLMEQHAAQVKTMLDGLRIQMGQQVISLMPGFINMMTGKDLFPPEQVDASLADVMIKTTTPEERHALISMIRTKPNGGPLATVLADQLGRAQARKDAVDAEAGKQQSMASGRMDLGELDAMGTAYKALQTGMVPPEPAKKALPAKVYEVIDAAPQGVGVNVDGLSVSNGDVSDSNGATEGPNEESETSDTSDTKRLDKLFDAMGPNAEMVFNMLEGQDPELAKDIRARFAARKT